MRKAAIACFAVLDYTKQRILVECSQVVEEEKTDMIFGEKTEEQKRVAELTREVKELRKELLASKLDKKQVEVQMKELKDALELGGNLCRFAGTYGSCKARTDQYDGGYERDSH